MSSMPSAVGEIPPIAVVALGDPSRGDDGIGVRVMGRVRTLIGEIGCVRTRKPVSSLLSALSLPESEHWSSRRAAGTMVEWIEGGTDARRLDTVLGGRLRVVLLDAVSLGHPPGTVLHWHLECSSRDRLSQIRQYGGRSRMGLQHLGLWLEDELPERGTDLIGVEPGNAAEGRELSAALLCRLPAICSQVTALMVRILEEEGW